MGVQWALSALGLACWRRLLGGRGRHPLSCRAALSRETRRGWWTQAPGRQGPCLEWCLLTTAALQAAAPGPWLALSERLLEDWGVAVGAGLRGPADSGHREPGTVS